MPSPDIIRLGQLDADRRLAAAFEILIRHFDVPLPDIAGPTPGSHPDWQRAERTRDLAIQAEAIVDHIRRPLAV